MARVVQRSQYTDLTASERGELEQLIRDNGAYPVCGERDELLALHDPEHREHVFVRVVLEGIERWMALADERLAGTGVRCFVTPGNDDFMEIDAPIQAAETVEFVEGRCVALDDTHDMLTTGYSNPTRGTPLASSARTGSIRRSAGWRRRRVIRSG